MDRRAANLGLAWTAAALVLAVSAGPAARPAAAATLHCVAGGSESAPQDFHDPASWTPAQAPGPGDDVLLDAPCWVECIAGDDCSARTLKGSHAQGGFVVGAGATLRLAGCDDASAASASTAECGAISGFHFSAQGAVIHDSALDGDPFVRGAALPGSPEVLRLVLDAPIDALPGDWLQIRSGPVRDHVYQVLAGDFAQCPTAAGCWLDVALHDPDMEFGHNPESAGYPAGIGYVDGAARFRVAGADAVAAADFDPSRCVEVCADETGGACADAGFLTRDHAYVGWFAGLGAGAPTPANPPLAVKRLLVVSSSNDVPARIGSGVVDRLCFADPLPAALVPATGYAATRGAFWPGFWPGDGWRIFRPARVRYEGLEGDGGLGFHSACVDADFAYFDNWARIATLVGTPACQEPYQDTVITSWAEGLPPDIVHQAAACNDHSLQVWFYDALRGDRVAIVDTRTPVDTSATCNTASGPVDTAPDSGHHGVSLSNTRFDSGDPPSNWLIRYAGDDGVIARTNGLGAVELLFRDWTWWYMLQGASGNVIGFGNSAPGQTVLLENARTVMWTRTTGCTAALVDPYSNVAFEVDGWWSLDPQFRGMLAQGDDENIVMRDVVALGARDSTCQVLLGGALSDAWIEGWNRLFKETTNGVRRVFFRAGNGAAGGAILAEPAAGPPVVVRDFVLENLPDISLLDPVCTGACSVDLGDGYAAWRTPTLGHAVANFVTSANLTLAQPLEGVVVRDRRLLRCTPAWGAANGASLDVNLLAANVSGAPIEQVSACPLAAAQTVLPSGDPAVTSTYTPTVGGRAFGPRAAVGIDAGATFVAALGVANSYRLGAKACWDGFDNDGDGGTDYPADPGCKDADGTIESPSCDDEIDNDSDGHIDFPADPQCKYAWDKSESCGLGFEIAPAILLLRALRRRRRATPA